MSSTAGATASLRPDAPVLIDGGRSRIMSGVDNDSSTSSWSVSAIGTVSTPRVEAIDDDWGEVISTITLTPAFSADALVGLDAFSHLEIIYLFHQVEPDAVHTGLRVPRNNPAWPPVGIFAQRARNRFNRLGLATCELVEVRGTTLAVRGLDAIDGTPVLDIKPYMTEFAPRSAVLQPTWSHELMAGYW